MEGNKRATMVAMGKALYRKYRSQSLDEIVGQEHITTTLKNALKQGRISHAYLFTGPRGVGKTSIARILAFEVNNLPYDEQGTHLDIIEIDAASNQSLVPSSFGMTFCVDGDAERIEVEARWGSYERVPNE